MTATVTLALSQGVLAGVTILAGCFAVAGWQARRAYDVYRRRHGHPPRWFSHVGPPDEGPARWWNGPRGGDAA